MENIITIRNLTKSNSTSDSDLIDSIHELFNNNMTISIPRDCIRISHAENDQRSATLKLRSQDEVYKALDKLKDRRSRNGLGFRFQKIADMSVDITVHMKLPEKYLRLGQQLGNEDRKKEFKKGGGDYVYRYLRDDVSKYACGFLNGMVGGTLYIGVDENGFVVGVQCDNNEEDRIRRNYIDEAIGDIEPPLGNTDYDVEFVPVEENGKLKVNYKVIKISVFKRRKLKKLFETRRGHIYMRRDGSVRDFTAAQAQEWAMQNVHSRACMLM